MQFTDWLQLSDACRTFQGAMPEVTVSKGVLARATVTVLVPPDMMDSQVGQSLDGPSLSLCAICFSCSSFTQEYLWVKIYKMGGCHPPLMEKW